MASTVPNSEATQFKSGDRAVECGRKGGIASGESKRKKATMLSVLEKTLDETNNKGLTYRELVTLGLIKGAMNGSSKNYELITNMMEQKERKESDLPSEGKQQPEDEGDTSWFDSLEEY